MSGGIRYLPRGAGILETGNRRVIPNLPRGAGGLGTCHLWEILYIPLIPPLSGVDGHPTPFTLCSNRPLLMLSGVDGGHTPLISCSNPPILLLPLLPGVNGRSPAPQAMLPGVDRGSPPLSSLLFLPTPRDTSVTSSPSPTWSNLPAPQNS